MVRKGCSVDRHSPARLHSPTRLSQKADLQLAYHASPSPPSSSSGSMEEPTARERAFRPPCPLPLRQAGCWLALRGRMELARTVGKDGDRGWRGQGGRVDGAHERRFPWHCKQPSTRERTFSSFYPPPMRQAGSWVAWWGRGGEQGHGEEGARRWAAG